MNKSQRVELVMTAIKKSGCSFEILDEKEGIARHVRVLIDDEKFDVWPQSGTFGSKGKFVRNNADGFIKLLGVKIDTKTNSQRITDLEEYCAYLENEISRIKGVLNWN